jgi:hypothetical protein
MGRFPEREVPEENGVCCENPSPGAVDLRGGSAGGGSKVVLGRGGSGGGKSLWIKTAVV